MRNDVESWGVDAAPGIDGTGATRPGAAEPDDRRRRTEPTLGSVRSDGLIRAMAESGGGWLHVDGGAASMGTLHGDVPLRALRGASPPLDQLFANRDVVAHLKKHEYDRLLARHVASFGDDLAFEAEEVSEQIEECYPLPDIEDDLAAIGWHRITIEWRRGLNVGSRRTHQPLPPAILGYMTSIAGRLGGRLAPEGARAAAGTPPWATPSPAPHPDDYDGFTTETFEGLPGFGSYDPVTRVITFADRAVTVTLPGGLVPGATARGP